VTGWRIDTEVLPLVWCQVEFAAGEVRIDDPRSTKTRKPGSFPSPTISRRVLKAQRKLTESLNSAYVFCHVAGTPLGNA